MDQSQQERTVGAPSSSRSYQFHPARAAIVDLFNLYLGVYYIQSLPPSPTSRISISLLISPFYFTERKPSKAR